MVDYFSIIALLDNKKINMDVDEQETIIYVGVPGKMFSFYII